MHADYLCAVMLCFDFPARFESSIKQLFFGNNMYRNVNEYFTEAVHQERGIKQGDPLSFLLFDIALEPFLLSIIWDTQLQGFQIKDELSLLPSSCWVYNWVLPTEIFSIHRWCLYFSEKQCWLDSLKHHMRRYASVPNAKFNEGKSEVFFLNGRLSLTWQTQFLMNMKIHVHHHQQGSGNAFRYLHTYLPNECKQQRKCCYRPLDNNSIYMVRGNSLFWVRLKLWVA